MSAAEKKTGLQDRDALMMQYCESRDVELRNQLAAEHLGIAEMLARRFSGKGVEYDDLFQVASLALIKALDRYDGSTGVRFTSYAVPTMVGEIKHYFRDRLRLVRIPRKNSEMLKTIHEARETLAQELKRMPTVDEIAMRLGADASDVLETLETGVAAHIASLDQPGEEGEDGILATLGSEDPAYEQINNKEFLLEVMKTLSAFERTILTQRYLERRSQRDIAREHHVSQMYISNLERKLLERFRRKLI